MRLSETSAAGLKNSLGLAGVLGSPYAPPPDRRKRAKVLLAPINCLFKRLAFYGLPVDGFLLRNDIKYVFELVVRSEYELRRLPDPSGYHHNYWLRGIEDGLTGPGLMLDSRLPSDLAAGPVPRATCQRLHAILSHQYDEAWYQSMDETTALVLDAISDDPWGAHLHFSKRLETCLRYSPFRTVGELLSATDADLLGVKGIGRSLLRAFRVDLAKNMTRLPEMVSSPFLAERILARGLLRAPIFGARFRQSGREVAIAPGRLNLGLLAALLEASEIPLPLSKSSFGHRTPREMLVQATVNEWRSSSDTLPRLVHEALAQLPERERMVIRLWYFEHHTLEMIGCRENVTRERIQQIRHKALRRCRARTGHRIGFLVLPIFDRMAVTGGELHHTELERMFPDLDTRLLLLALHIVGEREFFFRRGEVLTRKGQGRRHHKKIQS